VIDKVFITIIANSQTKNLRVIPKREGTDSSELRRLVAAAALLDTKILVANL